MKPYPSLTIAGKRRRLHTLARSAMERYPLQVARFKLLSASTNLIYRVTSPSGEQFVLRLASPGWRTLENLQAEALWLDALVRDTHLRLPEIIRSRAGEAVVTLTSDSVPGPRHFTLMRALPGRLLGKSLTETNLEKMGCLFATLHAQSAAWQPPPGFNPHRFEHILSRREPLVLFDPEQTSAFPPGTLPIFQDLYNRVEAEYDSLDRSDLRVIHCDLWHDNIMVYKGQLCPFDFEDTIWGFRLHDIAMAMLDLLETVGAERYAPLVQAFQSGYTAHLPWPAGDLTLLQIGRLFWKLNWVARFDRPHLPQMLASYTRLFDLYHQSGKLQLPIAP